MLIFAMADETDKISFIKMEEPTEVFEICFRNEKGDFGMPVAAIAIPFELQKGYPLPLEFTVRPSKPFTNHESDESELQRNNRDDSGTKKRFEYIP